MTFSKRQVSKLNRIVATIQEMLAKGEKAAKAEAKAGKAKAAVGGAIGQPRTRRSGDAAKKMRTDILAK